ncbi:phytoene synthase [Sphingomonas sp. PvP055]|uniref:squalene/phytoene synthase family protein n=1 Tax=Sphingomonas sp. PvP055 TaxID=3156391 RepID=UPI003391494D
MSATDDPERALALSYAPVGMRGAMEALLALDATLGGILRTTREPMVGQMRLTWWHEALSALDTAPPPAQPVLQALSADVVAHGISGTVLAGMIDGWEMLLEPELLDRDMLESYAKHRGGKLFLIAGELLGTGPRDPLERAGEGWALADLARHSRDPVAASRTRDLAMTVLSDAMQQRWSRNARSLGAMTLSARFDLAGDGVSAPVTSPARIARLAWHRLSGR